MDSDKTYKTSAGAVDLHIWDSCELSVAVRDMTHVLLFLEIKGFNMRESKKEDIDFFIDHITHRWITPEEHDDKSKECAEAFSKFIKLYVETSNAELLDRVEQPGD
jgi:hypothetical protein